MVWCHQAPKHWPEPMLTMLFAAIWHHWDQWVNNTLRPRQNGRRFPDDIFKCIFLNENVLILMKIPLKFVPKGPINDIPALVQKMAWHRSGDKPLSEPMMVSYWRIYASLGLNELNNETIHYNQMSVHTVLKYKASLLKIYATWSGGENLINQ